MTHTPKNPVGWFQIPVEDFDRAIKFYEAVFGQPLKRVDMGEGSMALFPSDEHTHGISGCLVKHPKSHPSNKGTLVHFESPSGDLAHELKLVKDAGGTVVQDKTSIGPNGFFAFIADTEGNQIGIHSMQ